MKHVYANFMTATATAPMNAAAAPVCASQATSSRLAMDAALIAVSIFVFLTHLVGEISRRLSIMAVGARRFEKTYRMI